MRTTFLVLFLSNYSKKLRVNWYSNSLRVPFLQLVVAGDHNIMTSQGFRETYFVPPDISLSNILTGRYFVLSGFSGSEVTNTPLQKTALNFYQLHIFYILTLGGEGPSVTSSRLHRHLYVLNFQAAVGRYFLFVADAVVYIIFLYILFFIFV